MQTNPSLLQTSACRLLSIAAALGLSSFVAEASGIEITGSGAYSQNFDRLPSSGSGNTWSDNVTLSGWYSNRIAINAGTGSGTTGGLYSFGEAGASERALGSLGSSSASPVAYGLLLFNNSSNPITIDTIAYTGEQWRNGGNTTLHTLSLAYQRSDSPITTPASTSGWVDLPAGNFTGPIATSSSGALVGNDAANRSAISISPGITVASGEYLMIRWLDPDDAGSDHALAIDDLSIGWSVSSVPTLGLSITLNSFSENAGPNAATGTVSIPQPLGQNLEVSLASSDATEATVPANVAILAGQTSASFPIAAIDDSLADGAQSVTIAATAEGYVSAQSNITVLEDLIDAPISVTVYPASFPENAGSNAAVGTVSLAADTLSDLTISLVSSNTSAATVPGSVVIGAGGKSATFPVNAVDNSFPNAPRSVNISANAVGYTSGSALIEVLDDGDVAPPPTLAPGAIAFVGFNADANDNLAFVTITPIAGGDVIHFSDNEWNGLLVGSGGEFSTGEGYLTWTAPQSGVSAGTVVSLENLTQSNRSASIGTIAGAGGSFNIAPSEETVYAFQGSAAQLGATGFLAFVANHSLDLVAGTGLSAEHGVYLPLGADIAAYIGSRSSQVTFVGYLALISSTANWISQDDTGDQSSDGTAPDLSFDATSFTLASSPTNTFASWMSGYDFSAYPGADLGFMGDADKDGVPNALENILGSSPATPSQGLTAVSVGPGTLGFRHTLNATPASDLTPTYEWSLDLVNWNASGASVGGTTVTFGAPVVVNPGPPDLVQVNATVSGSAASKVFARLKVD